MSDDKLVERAKQESCHTELVRFVQEAICNRKGLRIVRLSDGIEAAKDAIAAVMSSWTDRDMLVGGRLFPAGSITVVDVLDHAARAALQSERASMEGIAPTAAMVAAGMDAWERTAGTREDMLRNAFVAMLEYRAALNPTGKAE